jgi:hypothetical protein
MAIGHETGTEKGGVALSVTMTGSPTSQSRHRQMDLDRRNVMLKLHNFNSECLITNNSTRKDCTHVHRTTTAV